MRLKLQENCYHYLQFCMSLIIQLRGLGERCKLPSGIWGEAPEEIESGAF